MHKFESLSSGLLFVDEQKSTGKLSVVGKLGKSMEVGTIVLRRGEIVSAKCSKKSGHEALELMLTFEIVKLFFVQTPIPKSENAQDLPSTADLLQQLDGSAPRINQSNVGIAPAIDLKRESLLLLETLFGAAASKKIDAIAEKYPPAEEPLAFLSSCKKVVEPVFGSTVAEQTFSSIHRRLQSK